MKLCDLTRSYCKVGSILGLRHAKYKEYYPKLTNYPAFTGEKLNKNYLSVSEVFRNVMIPEQAEIVEKAKACVWVGLDLVSGSNVKQLLKQDDGIVYGFKHNERLYGYFNLKHVHSMVKKRVLTGKACDINAVSTEADLREADLRDSPNTLMQML